MYVHRRSCQKGCPATHTYRTSGFLYYIDLSAVDCHAQVYTVLSWGCWLVPRQTTTASPLNRCSRATTRGNTICPPPPTLQRYSLPRRMGTNSAQERSPAGPYSAQRSRVLHRERGEVPLRQRVASRPWEGRPGAVRCPMLKRKTCVTDN
ncbi:hypothetical protein E2C01_021770 [Portunus trituberculatus]|uniref:Uncharacterized protein n=1 Tax=Portunus trituberculatus TaxID=210409 RepID=A0A5B7E3G9_PORTR|nr:hypothetical protein [Portunus trituberculatus]